MNKMPKIGNVGDVEKDNQEAYNPINVTYAYSALAGIVPTTTILKYYDTGILKSVKSLELQIQADGLSHVRVKVYDSQGKWDEVFQDDYENGRMRAFYLIVYRTIYGYHTVDLLERFGFNSREEVINYLPELYTKEAVPKLRVKKFGSIRDILTILRNA